MLDLTNPSLSLVEGTDSQKSPEWAIVIAKLHQDLNSSSIFGR